MSNKMWGGRFTERPDAIMEEINVSIDVDRHLFAQDIAASRAHAAMLATQGIISKNDAKNIAGGLDTILSEIGKGSFAFKRPLEDIHMNVESRLSELIGPAAGRLHTARSRHDGESARVRPADGQFARRGVGSRLRARNPVGRIDRRGAFVALRRGNRD